MIREQYERLKMGQDLRKTLIELKQELKEETARKELLAILEGDYSLFARMLEESDPKVRKNAALVLGKLGQNENVPLLYQAYEKEQQ